MSHSDTGLHSMGPRALLAMMLIGTSQKSASASELLFPQLSNPALIGVSVTFGDPTGEDEFANLGMGPSLRPPRGVHRAHLYQAYKPCFIRAGPPPTYGIVW